MDNNFFDTVQGIYPSNAVSVWVMPYRDFETFASSPYRQTFDRKIFGGRYSDYLCYSVSTDSSVLRGEV